MKLKELEFSSFISKLETEKEKLKGDYEKKIE